MKASILPIDTDEHRHAEQLLPWYVNGTLDAKEQSRVDAHLSQCTRCRADAAFQARLRDIAGVVPVAADVARGWAALRAQLAQKPVVAKRHGTRVPLRWMGLWPLMLGIQGAVLLGFAIALVSATLRPEPYHALGATLSAPTANALVVFRPDATEAQIRAALRASDARLVGGPTVTDAYLLQVPGPGPQALARLRAQPAVSRVESLVGEGSR